MHFCFETISSMVTDSKEGRLLYDGVRDNNSRSHDRLSVDFSQFEMVKYRIVSLRNAGLTLLLVSSVAYIIYYTQLTLFRSESYSYSTIETSTVMQQPEPVIKFTVKYNNTPYPVVEKYTRYAVAQLGLSPVNNTEPLIPEFGPVINDVLSFQYPISIRPCWKYLNVNKTVVILVNSAPGNFDRRKVIRQTWKNHLTDMHEEDVMGIAGFAFVLGLTDDNVTQIKIEKEAKTYEDIIQIGMADFYRNLSLKVAGLFNWLYRFCAKVDFVVKVDDDVYINMRNVIQFFRSYNTSKSLGMFGSAAGNLWPARDGKWKMTYEDWPWNSYPPYFFGPTVLFPGNVIVPLLAAFQTTPMLDIDDVYFTGICSQKAGVKLHSSTKSTSFFVMGLPEFPLPCDLRRFVTWLTVSQNQMNNSHVATEDFYQNRTQCIVANSNGINTTVDYTEPVQFFFT